MISWTASGARASDFRTVFCPRSMRRAISTSPSRVSSGTVPISRRYMRTGSLIFSPTPAGSSRSRISSPSSSFLIEILGLFQDFDAGDIQAGQDVLEFGAAGDIAGQNFADFVVQDVALLLAHLYEPLQPLVFIFQRH